MSEIDVEGLRKLLEAAQYSPTPWEYDAQFGSVDDANGWMVLGDVQDSCAADLIVALRNSAPALLDEIESLRRWKETHSVSSTLRTRAETAERERDEWRFGFTGAERRNAALENGIGEMLQAFDGTDVALQARTMDALRAILAPKDGAR